MKKHQICSIFLTAILSVLLLFSCGSDDAATDGDSDLDLGPVACEVDMDCPAGFFCQLEFCRPLGWIDGDDIPFIDGDDPSDGDDTTDGDDLPPTDGDLSAGRLCDPCSLNSQCAGAADRCLAHEEGDFCSRSCVDRDCPLSYVCVELADVEGELSLQCVSPSGSCDPEASCLLTGCWGEYSCNPETERCEAYRGDVDHCERCETDEECMRFTDRCVPDLSGREYCLQGCSEYDLCPEVYDAACHLLSQSTSSVCIPNDGYCVDPVCDTMECPPRMACVEESGGCEYAGNHCHVTDCPQMSDCNELTGECEMDPLHCLSTGCDEGFSCNTRSGICEWGTTPDGDDDPVDGDSSVVGDYCGWCEGQEDCGQGGACIINNETYDQFCITPCETHWDCPSGAACRNDVTGWDVCVPNNMSCNPSQIGGSCTGPADCISDTCITHSYQWPNGYCTAMCDDAQNPCPAGSFCVEVEFNPGEWYNLCLRDCTNSTCRNNYYCEQGLFCLGIYYGL